MDRPLYLGIDLWTTNSAASVFDGEQLLAIRTQGRETLTPSVVRIDAKGGVSVGARVFRWLRRLVPADHDDLKLLRANEKLSYGAAS